MLQGVTVVIPTMLKVEKRIFQYLINEMVANHAVKKIVIIDNTGEGLFKENFSFARKMEVIENDENVGVNPAWNQGMKKCETEYYCIINDDIMCERTIIDDLLAVFKDPKIGIATVYTADPRLQKIDQEAYRLQKRPEGEIKVAELPVTRYDGWFMFGRTELWEPIDERLKIFYGDNFIYSRLRHMGYKTVILVSRFIVHEVSTTVIAEDHYNKPTLQNEKKIWEEIAEKAGYANALVDPTKAPKVVPIDSKKREIVNKTICLCMIVKDEEKFLERCLESAKDAVDQIVIVDTGSSDKTINIANKYTEDVHLFPWTGSFAEARNFALSKVTSDWVLVMDADEVLVEGSKEELIKLANINLTRPVSYQVKIKNIMAENQGVEHYVARFFPLIDNIRFQGAIHEFLVADKEIISVVSDSVVIEHYGYHNEMISGRNKIDRNKESLLKELETDPDSPFYLYHLALTYRVEGDHEKCAETLEKWTKVIEAHPNFDISMGYAAYMGALVSLKRDVDAIKIGEPVISRCTNNPDYCLNLAIAYEHVEDYEKAQRMLEMAIATRGKPVRTLSYDKDSNGWKALAVLGNIKAKLKKFPEAIEIWEAAIREAPKNLDLFKALISASINTMDLERAEKYLMAFKEMFPEKVDTQIRATLANVLINRDKVREALGVLKEDSGYKSLVEQLLGSLISSSNFELAEKVDKIYSEDK